MPPLPRTSSARPHCSSARRRSVASSSASRSPPPRPLYPLLPLDQPALDLAVVGESPLPHLNSSYVPPLAAGALPPLHPIRCSAASPDLSPGASAPAPPKPQIELEFLGPKPGVDGSYPVDTAAAVSGDKLLRDIMTENKLELYAAYGKLMNCGGSGSCGTYIVEIIEGKELMNERTDTEKRYLKKKPESWRLTCETIVGNKENSGKVVVQRLPQWKK